MVRARKFYRARLAIIKEKSNGEQREFDPSFDLSVGACLRNICSARCSWVAAAAAPARQVGANVSGVATGESGAALPGVTVTITNNNNGAVQTLVTGPEGNYRAVNLSRRRMKSSPS